MPGMPSYTKKFAGLEQPCLRCSAVGVKKYISSQSVYKDKKRFKVFTFKCAVCNCNFKISHTDMDKLLNPLPKDEINI